MRTFTIEPLHAPSMEACRLRIDNLTKPIYSLATLEVQVRAGQRGSCQRRVRALRQRGRSPRQEPVDAQDHRLCR